MFIGLYIVIGFLVTIAVLINPMVIIFLTEQSKKFLNKEHLGAQIALRAWPFGRGTSKIMNTFFPNRKFSELIATVKTTDGVRLKIIPNELIGRHLYLTGEYERSVIDVLCNLANPGDVLLDIGANIGYISACFLQNVSRSKVIAVEPQPGVLSLLRDNLSQFPARFSIHPVGISEQSGTASFALDRDNLGNGRISKDGEIRIQITRGDDLFSHLDRINLIKIDVQGHELQVIRSMQSTIKRLRPKAILFEDDCSKLGEIVEVLSALGYHTRAIQKTMFGFRVRNLGEGSADNYLATI